MPNPIPSFMPFRHSQQERKEGLPSMGKKRMPIRDDSALSGDKVGDYYTAVRRVLTNQAKIRDNMEVLFLTSWKLLLSASASPVLPEDLMDHEIKFSTMDIKYLAG